MPIAYPDGFQEEIRARHHVEWTICQNRRSRTRNIHLPSMGRSSENICYKLGQRTQRPALRTDQRKILSWKRFQFCFS